MKEIWELVDDFRDSHDDPPAPRGWHRFARINYRQKRKMRNLWRDFRWASRDARDQMGNYEGEQKLRRGKDEFLNHDDGSAEGASSDSGACSEGEHDLEYERHVSLFKRDSKRSKWHEEGDDADDEA